MDVKSYLMGIFDGEGSVSAYQQRGRWALTITVTMNSETIIRMFQELWGGGVHQRKKPTVGGLMLWQWYISASRAIPFLTEASEMLLLKNRQATIALELAKSMSKYADPGTRKGINLAIRDRYITPEDQAERTRLILEMRALNGGRSRFDPVASTVTTT